ATPATQIVVSGKRVIPLSKTKYYGCQNCTHLRFNSQRGVFCSRSVSECCASSRQSRCVESSRRWKVARHLGGAVCRTREERRTRTRVGWDPSRRPHCTVVGKPSRVVDRRSGDPESRRD